MPAYERSVPVLQVADVAASVRWYAEALGFAGDPFPEKPPHSFAILRRDGAEIMLQCAAPPPAAHAAAAPGGRAADPEFRWSVYLRVAGTAVLDLAAAIEKKARLLRGPERMFYGLVEIELLDPDGHRVCVGGVAPAGASVEPRRESAGRP